MNWKFWEKEPVKPFKYTGPAPKPKKKPESIKK